MSPIMREKWPRDGDRQVASWPAFVAGAAVVLIAAILILFFVLPFLLSVFLSGLEHL